MEKLNKLFAIAQRADAAGNLIECVNPHEIIDIAEEFLSLKDRAESAEDKLAEIKAQRDDFEKSALYSAATNKKLVAKLEDLTSQKPYGFVHNIVDPPGCGVAASIFKEENRHYGRPVFTRPATAVSLAELVPVLTRLKRRYICNEGSDLEFIACVTPEQSSIGTGGAWDDWRELSTILRNIEEHKA